MPGTSPAIEDYLKTVYAHTEWQPDAITPLVLATRLGIAPSSVTEMVKKMAGLGLVTQIPYKAIRLTDAGRLRALAAVRRHRLIETWLVQEMGYACDEAPTGHEGHVIRISDRDPAVLRELDMARIGPGSELRVTDAASEASVVVTLAGRHQAVTRTVAEMIWISA